MIDVFALGRPAGDLLSRFVRITLGGTTYELPTLPMGGNRRWKEQLDQRLSGLLNGLQDSDKKNAPEQVATIFALLQGQIDDLLSLLYAYDGATTAEGVPFHPPVLPDRLVLEEGVYEDEIVAAVREVWRAANPLVDMTLREVATSEPPTSDSLPPTSSSRRSTAGSRRKSRKN